MSVPLDSDGFMRRECPTCEQEFKWRASQDGDEVVVHVDQYYCPLCGVPSGVDNWWTQAQLDYMEALVVPDALRDIQNMLGDAFRGNKHVKFEASSEIGVTPMPAALFEPDDMVIVEPPCHAFEPVKIPEHHPGPFHCLVCGSQYAA
jgi:hypothetical protein